jgi:hypothetical protein
VLRRDGVPVAQRDILPGRRDGLRLPRGDSLGESPAEWQLGESIEATLSVMRETRWVDRASR